MTENEKLTEKRDGQNTIPLRQDGKTKWVLASAGMGKASTQFLYGTHADRLAEYEAIGTIEEFKALKEKNTPKKPFGGMYDWTCPTCGTYHSTHGKCCSECMQMILWD